MFEKRKLLPVGVTVSVFTIIYITIFFQIRVAVLIGLVQVVTAKWLAEEQGVPVVAEPELPALVPVVLAWERHVAVVVESLQVVHCASPVAVAC